MRLTLAMFGVFRRRVVSGSSSASVLLHPRIVGKDQIVCHTVQSGAVNLRPLRKVMTSLKPCVSMQIQSRMFSSDSGDLVDVAVPFMGESISYGTLATFLKKTGEMVEVNEPIAQVKTDMVTINVASPEAGVIQEVNIINVASPEAGVIQEFVVKERDSVESGTKIAIISKSAAASPSPPKDETDPGGIKEEMKDMKKKIDEILDNLAVRKEMKEMKKELESDALGLRKEIKIIQECTSFHGIGFLILIIYWFMK